ncbi:uncharacterized protein LOC134668758 isoform X1 [Cydia fagiglandana]|uniref:uncharacterized protein LOC134668758 isoform X1 n=1 Tax=Cydia fagiglandana TaxID=1458189 RepID=UPI002FEE2EAB
MILAATLALVLTFGATLVPNVTEEHLIEHWKYDRETRRKVLHEKLSKAFAEEDTKRKKPCTATDWSLDNFIERYLAEAPHHSLYRPPENETIDNLIENNDKALFHPYVFEDYFKKYGIGENKEREKNVNKTPDSWKFTDFIEKYEATTVWEQIKQEALIIGRNDTHDIKFFLLSKGVDSTDELLGLEVPRTGRRFWNNQWPVPLPEDRESLKNGDLETIIYFMRQAIYHTRDRMKVMQQLRDKYRARAVYKMGYLFAKTDYACKIFGSLAFKAFTDCSVTRNKIFGENRVFKFYLDIAYNIERLLARWFDVDMSKDLLMSNDFIARKVLLKDKNLTTPAMVNEAFDQMFIE